MLPFRIELNTGEPLHRQGVYAVKKALVSGRLLPGDAFPSVRMLAQELRINPNTAHRIVSSLIEEGLLEVIPGVGTRVAKGTPSARKQRGELLTREAERLVVEARSCSLELDDVIEAVRRQWATFEEVSK
jgi:GntR family transcriptional regulator